jgi:cysteinyl-tRNA synthetase
MKRIVKNNGRRSMAFSCLMFSALVLTMLMVPLMYNPLGAVDNAEAGKYGNITPTSFELQLLDKINENRSENGAGPLSLNTSLWWVARAHSQDMIDNDFFEHSSSQEGQFNGASFSQRVKSYAGYSGSRIGECIAWNSWGPDPEWCMATWKDSSGHWSIIIDPDYTEIGLGILQGEWDGWSNSGLYTADFGGNPLSVDLDIMEEDIEFNPQSPNLGDTVTITATIHNIGSTDAYPLSIKFFDGDPDSQGIQIGDTKDIPHILIQGESAQINVTWDTQGKSQDHDIYVILDSEDLISETDETNNKAFRFLSLETPNPPIVLSPGWNLVSFPYLVNDKSLATVLGSINGQYDRVQTFEASDALDSGKNYHSEKPSYLNDLKNLDNSMGFWIHITDPNGASLVVEGDVPNSTQSISLHAGWNLVGYPSEIQRSRYDALNNLDLLRDLDTIQFYNATEKTWQKITSNDSFVPGKGYWIHAKRDLIWTLPEEDEIYPLVLPEINYWGYQLQSISHVGVVDALVNSHYDMLVIEPTRTDWSSDDKNFDTWGMLESLKASYASDGVHRKLILAYIDIGEAEEWRWYWNWSKDWPSGTEKPSDWPDFIIAHDPDGWEGNYPVAYWDDEWKDIIIYGDNQSSAPYGDYNSAIDEAIKDGFDGIYIDWVGAFEDDTVIAEASIQGVDPAAEMIQFIQEMKDYAWERNPDFLIIQQNAVSLCDGHPELFSKIDAIAQEAIWYDGEPTDDWNDPYGYDFANDLDLTNYYLDYLAQYMTEGITIFNCEYALDQADEAYTNSYDNGFIPYCSRVSLSKLTTTPPPGY